MQQISKTDVASAQAGDAKALELIVRRIQSRLYKLSLRMLADPDLAQDATQEILIRVITKLSTFQGQSSFETWSYRVATNYLLTARKVLTKDPGLTFSAFADDLFDGLADENAAAPDDHVMLNELRLKCTMAMLLCLDPPHRAAYILGEVLEFEHVDAADVLSISQANFRKRLSRARKQVQAFTAQTCGLANSSAPCSCSKRLPAAMAIGRIGHTPSAELSDAPSFTDVKVAAEKAAFDLRTAKLQRATGPLHPLKDYANAVLKLIDPPG
ncbi:RNA polymerase sigma factor [Epibacterium ulvae]|uniref:RNA polymerase sigma factor n=1 Tax=Epibacterium ulvae TaxID=1156985 RepID=UPI00249002F4|nr:RNA polymerase sigma factor [Epibacterium ulvae]